MKRKFEAFIVFFSLIFALQNITYAAPTEWGKVDVSLSQLLNSGWQIIGHSSNRAAVGNAGAANNYDNSNYTYVLTKNGRYVTCIIVNPSPPIAQVNACRSLN